MWEDLKNVHWVIKAQAECLEEQYQERRINNRFIPHPIILKDLIQICRQILFLNPARNSLVFFAHISHLKPYQKALIKNIQEHVDDLFSTIYIDALNDYNSQYWNKLPLCKIDELTQENVLKWAEKNREELKKIKLTFPVVSRNFPQVTTHIVANLFAEKIGENCKWQTAERVEDSSDLEEISEEVLDDATLN